MILLIVYQDCSTASGLCIYCISEDNINVVAILIKMSSAIGFGFLTAKVKTSCNII